MFNVLCINAPFNVKSSGRWSVKGLHSVITSKYEKRHESIIDKCKRYKVKCKYELICYESEFTFSYERMVYWN